MSLSKAGMSSSCPVCHLDTCPRSTLQRLANRWLASPWALLDQARPEAGPWLVVAPAGGKWTLTCKACEALASKGMPANLAFGFGSLAGPRIRVSLLQRHAKTNFHKLCVARLLEGETDLTPMAPSLAAFKKVIGHVVDHSSAAHRGIDEIGAGKKVLKMIRCCAEACQIMDMRFFKNLQSVALMRDARQGRLHIRFTAVDSELRVRRGMLGMVSAFGTGGLAVAKATRKIVDDFATVLRGTKRAKLNSGLQQNILQKTQMITVDSAADEIVASEIGRNRLSTVLGPIVPNCRILLRDKAHSARRTQAVARQVSC